MKLRAAARAFDKTPIVDAYDGTIYGKGQFDLYDDSRRDAYGVDRRILSADPVVSVPPRRVIRTDNDVWLVGEFQPDFWRGKELRHKYVVHQAVGLATVRTLGERVRGASGFTAYASEAWVKDAKRIEDTALSASLFDLLFSSAETIPVPSLITIGSDEFLATSKHITSGGFHVLRCERLEWNALTTAALKRVVYDPRLDVEAETETEVEVIDLPHQALYEMRSVAALEHQVGDRVLVFADTVGVEAGDRLDVSGRTLQALSVEVWADAQVVLARPQ